MSSVTENLARIRSEQANINAQQAYIDHARILDEHEEAMREHEEVMRAPEKAMQEHNAGMRELEKAMRAPGQAMGEHNAAMRELEKAMRAPGQAMGEHQAAMRGFEEAMRGHVEAMQAPEKAMQEHEAVMRELEKAMFGHGREHRHGHGHRHGQEMAGHRDQSHSLKRKRRNERDSHDNRFRFKDRAQDTRHPNLPRPDKPTAEAIDKFTAHPLGRPPPTAADLDPTMNSNMMRGSGHPAIDPDTAFKTSLFDALADDEGAAAYWEGVYSQPIHIYARPGSTPSAAEKPATHDGRGPALDAMTDDEYAAYVKQKMWERAHPHEARELRYKREAAHKGKSKASRTDDPRNAKSDRRVRAEMEAALERGRRRKREKLLAAAWEQYSSAWDALVASSSSSADTPTLATTTQPRLSWPVTATARMHDTPDLALAATVADIRAFFLEAPLQQDETRLARLKAERFKWHPDKMAHRFGKMLGADDGALKKAVTGVFQIVDELVASQRLE